MSLENTINEAIKAAMKQKDKLSLDALRAVKAQILLAKTDGKTDTLDQASELAILQRMMKQRKDSASQFRAQNREDLAKTEEEQMAVIEQNLPEEMDEAALETLVRGVISDTGAESMKDMGKVMSAATEKAAGGADGKRISEMVKKLLG